MKRAFICIELDGDASWMLPVQVASANVQIPTVYLDNRSTLSTAM
ncbi:hypothetical protein M3J09_002393 [Ascochyta lentis]